MAIIIHIDVMLAKRKMSVTELSERVGITMANLFDPEERQSKSHPLVHFGSCLQGVGLSTGGRAGVPARRMK